MAASSGKKSSRSKKSRSSSAKSSKSSLWHQIKTIGISIIVVYWLASCFTVGVSDFEIFDEGHWVTAKARAEKVAAFTAEHPEAFIMDVWGFGDRTKINPVIAGADSGVRVWCINSHEVTKTPAEAAQKLCKTTKSGPTTIAIYGGNFANVDFSTNTSGSGSLELTVQQWGNNKYKGLEKMFAGFHTVEFADDAGVPDLSQATSIERVFEYVESIIGEAYSAAGEMGFGWWLVEHYFSYHVDCPDGCVSGEPARGRKDPPYFQVGYGSFDHIPDLVDSLVEVLLPVQ